MLVLYDLTQRCINFIMKQPLIIFASRGVATQQSRQYRITSSALLATQKCCLRDLAKFLVRSFLFQDVIPKFGYDVFFIERSTNLDYKNLAKSVVIRYVNNKPVVAAYAQSLKPVGAGRSAFVFKIENTNKAIKVYLPEFWHIAKEEACIYDVIQQINYYPEIYESGPNYIVIDYIEGHTFFECLTLGIPIEEEKLIEVDHALSVTKKCGLNPSDIHLRNILITPDGEIKLIDVARFRQIKKCNQWEDLKSAYYRYYNRPFFPKKLPAFLLNIIALCYKNFNRKQSKRFSKNEINF